MFYQGTTLDREKDKAKEILQKTIESAYERVPENDRNFFFPVYEYDREHNNQLTVVVYDDVYFNDRSPHQKHISGLREVTPREINGIPIRFMVKNMRDFPGHAAG